MFGVPLTITAAAAAVVGALGLLVWVWLGERRLEAGPVGPPDRRRITLQSSALDRVVRPVLDAVGRRAHRLTPAGWVQSVERKLALAGSTGATLERVLAGKLLLAGAGFMVGWVWVRPVTPSSLGLAGLLAILGWATPDVVLHGRATDRMAAIQTALPDTLDHLTISVEAGLGFDAALQRVAASGEGPLAAELDRAVNEVKIGIPRHQAFRNLLDRTSVPELRRFVVAVQQAEQYGLPIARVLRVQSAEMRAGRRLRAEERAMKTPVKIVFPLVMCIFPAMFIVLLGPAMIRILRTFG